jgi:serine acetyltransferase
MEERGYIAQALFDRLRDDGVEFSVLGDTRGYPENAPAEIEIAVPRGTVAAMPRAMARFSQDFDLQLVELAPRQQGWRFMFSWSDDIGRPRFIGVSVLGDYCRGARCLLRSEELVHAAPDALFAHALLESCERQHLDEACAGWLSRLWSDDPKGALERVTRFWPLSADERLIAQAARHGEWTAVRSNLPRLRRAMRRAVWPSLGAVLGRAALAARRALQPARAAIAFTGRESPLRGRVMVDVARDLSALGFELYEDRPGETRRADFRVVFDAPLGLARELDDVVAVDREHGMPAMVAEIERAILRWLECRVERRFPDAIVGENPRSARLLQFASRANLKLVAAFFNCSLECRIRSPILMPYPFGIVIERGAVIGSRVTVMHQVTIGRKGREETGVPVIEDNVFIGAGAKILGGVRVGRGATIGANAIVTRDVPSHCTVVGANRILGVEPVVGQRQPDHGRVVNM